MLQTVIPQIMCVIEKKCIVSLLSDQMHRVHLLDHETGEKHTTNAHLQARRSQITFHTRLKETT